MTLCKQLTPTLIAPLQETIHANHCFLYLNHKQNIGCHLITTTSTKEQNNKEDQNISTNN